MKDISKIMLGCFRIEKEEVTQSLKNCSLQPKDTVVYLWRNECSRVIADRFIDEDDIRKYTTFLNDITSR